MDNLSVVTHMHYPIPPHKWRHNKCHNRDWSFIIQNGFFPFTVLQAEMLFT